MVDDRKYVRELSKGSREAFEILYMRYASLVERFVVSLVKDESAADDIVQNVFMNLWNRRENLDKEGLIFRSYLYSSARNAVYDWFRRTEKFPKVPVDQVDMSGLPIADLQKKIENDEMLMLVNLAISGMPGRRKEIFNLSRVKGMKNAEIAELLGISEKTVEYHISKALEELRKLSWLIILFF